jgi:hypothetical protein
VELANRSYRTAALSFTAATAIALSPLLIPPTLSPSSPPVRTAPDIVLTVAPADIEVFIADLQAAFDKGTAAVTEVAGVPGRVLVGVVDNIVAAIDVTFTGLINATGDETAAESLTILKTLSHNAFAMLATNLGRIGSVITSTTAQVGDLITNAFTGSLQNVLVALVNVANDPLSIEKHLGLLTAGAASVALLIGNGVETIRAVSGAAFDIVQITVDEVTFQLENAAEGFSALLTQLGTAAAARPAEPAGPLPAALGVTAEDTARAETDEPEADALEGPMPPKALSADDRIAPDDPTVNVQEPAVEEPAFDEAAGPGDEGAEDDPRGETAAAVEDVETEAEEKSSDEPTEDPEPSTVTADKDPRPTGGHRVRLPSTPRGPRKSSSQLVPSRSMVQAM